jgi:hypothetical protein
LPEGNESYYSKVAVDIGYKELAIPYSKSKSTILKGLSAYHQL